jgi:subtilisin family serine protease
LAPQGDELARVLVTLKTDYRPEGALAAGAHAVQRKAIRSAQQDLLARIPTTGHRVISAYEVFPVIAMEADAATLAWLQRAPEVKSVQPDMLLSPADLESNAVMHAAVPLSLGFDGTGWAVAILDSGVQTNHPYLAGKVIAEACFSTTSGALNSISLCPNGQSTSGGTPGQAGGGSGVNCDAALFEECSHGTHLAGIAVGKDYPGGPGFNGIAPGAKLIAIQVFSKFTTAAQCGFGVAVPCVRALASDVIAALQYVYTTIRPDFGNIASVNLSFAESPSTSNCDGSAMKPAIDLLRSANIATVAAAGNNGLPNAIAEPACVSTAVSVGATTDTDSFAVFSNRASFMSLFAPGVRINSSVPTSSFLNFDGTSASAAAVSGAWALVMQQNPGFSVAQALNLLRTTGLTIPVAGGIPRVRLGDAFGIPTLPLTITQT